MPSIERDIERMIKQRNGDRTDVQCPRSVEWEVGRTFRCVVNTPAGRSLTGASVTMEDDGEVIYEVDPYYRG